MEQVDYLTFGLSNLRTIDKQSTDTPLRATTTSEHP